jgi:hypothetical protein
MDPVDATLAQARSLLGSAEPPQLPAVQFGQRLNPPHDWQGPASEAALARTELLQGRRDQLAGRYESVRQVVNASGQISTEARTAINGVHNGWQQDKAALAPYLGTPEGRSAYLAAGQARIAEANQVVTVAAQRFGVAAAQVRTLSSGLPTDVPTAPRPNEPTIREAGWHPKEGPADPLPPPPPGRGQPQDPADTRVGNPNFGTWENVPPPPPYVGNQPPPLRPEYRPFPPGDPLKVGPTTGMYTPGKTWIGGIDPPIVNGQEGYRFRMAGTEATTTTRMVFENGHWQEQRWVQNVYEYQRNTSLIPGGSFAGLPPLQNIDQTWKPISPSQIGSLSAANPGVTYYLPDGCGGVVKYIGGVPQGLGGPPSPPIMTRPR